MTEKRNDNETMKQYSCHRSAVVTIKKLQSVAKLLTVLKAAEI